MSAAANSDKSLDWTLVMLIIVLLSIGLVMLSSASMSVADGNTGSPFFYLQQQMFAVVAGAFVAFVMLQIPTDTCDEQD